MDICTFCSRQCEWPDCMATTARLRGYDPETEQFSDDVVECENHEDISNQVEVCR